MAHHDRAFKEKFLDRLENRYSANISKACKNTGVARRLVYDWRDKEEWFSDRLYEIREGFIDDVEEYVINEGRKTSVIAGMFILKTRRKEIYSQEPIIAISNNVGERTTFEIRTVISE